jgi:membrane-associated phospholipid phosphatase
MNHSPRLPSGAVLLWPLTAAICTLLFLGDLILVLSGRAADGDLQLGHTLYTGLQTHLPSPMFSFLRAAVLVNISFQQLRLSVGLLMAVMLALAIALIRHRRVSSATLLLVSMGGAVLGPAVLKSILIRPPPSRAGGHTFPSTHASGWLMLCAVLTYLVWHVTRRRGPTLAVGTVGTLLCATAGLYALRYHYPTEVLGGFLFAGAWLSWTVAWFLPRLQRETGGTLDTGDLAPPARAGGEQRYRRARARLHRPSIPK